MAIKVNASRSYGKSKSGGLRVNASRSTEKNNGSALGYLGLRTLYGAAGLVEGFSDFVVGSVYQMAGDKAYAKYLHDNDVVGGWERKLERDFNPGEGMRAAGDIASGVGQALPSVGLGIATGGLSTAASAAVSVAGSVALGTAYAGRAVTRAVQETGELSARENWYGILTGASEAATDFLLGGTQKAGKAIWNVAKGGSKAAAGKIARNGLVKGIWTSASSEFAEEFIQEYMDTGLLRATGVDADATTSFGDALYSGMIGFFTGGLLGGATNTIKTTSNIARGKSVRERGLTGNLLATANHVRSEYLGKDVDFSKIKSDALKFLSASVDAYNKLEVKEGTRADMLLGEIQAGLFAFESEANIGKIKREITTNPSEKRASDVSDMLGEAVTAEDLVNNRNGVADRAAVMSFTSALMSESRVDRVARAVRDAVVKERYANVREGASFDGSLSSEGERVYRMDDGRYAIVTADNREGGEGKYRLGFSETAEFDENRVMMLEQGATAEEIRRAFGGISDGSLVVGEKRLERAQARENAPVLNEGVVNGQVMARSANEAQRAENGGVEADKGSLRRALQKKISDVVDKALSNKGNLEVQYNQERLSQVPSDIAEMVSMASEGRIDISNKHVAIHGDNLWHEYIRHRDQSVETGRQQIALTPEGIKDAIEAIYDPDVVECVFSSANNPTQQQSFAYAKKSLDGYYIVVEAVGGKRNPNIIPVIVHQFTMEKWNDMIAAGKTIGELLHENDANKSAALDVEFNRRNRVTAAQFASKKAIANTPRSPRFNNSIPQNPEMSTDSGEKVAENIEAVDGSHRSALPKTREARERKLKRAQAHQKQVKERKRAERSAAERIATEIDRTDEPVASEQKDAGKSPAYNRGYTDAEANEARGLVGDFDTLSPSVRRAIVELVRSGKASGASKSFLKHSASLIAYWRRGLWIIADDKTRDDGFYTSFRDGSRLITVKPNREANAVADTLMHELAHDVWARADADMRRVLYELATVDAKAEEVDAVRKRYRDELTNRGELDGMAEAEVEALLDEEVATNLIGEVIGKEEFLGRFDGTETSTINRILRTLSNMKKRFTGKDRFLYRKAEDLFTAFTKVMAMEEVGAMEAGERKRNALSSKQRGYTEYDKPITLNDVEVLRSIGKKSINQFAQDEIKIAQKWAYKFYKELGVKSPFFRAWFGEWRAHDTSQIDFVSINSDRRKEIVNADTGWKIQVSRKVHKETSHQSGSSETNATKYLPYIDDITQKAVLFDSVISNKDNPNSLMFHAMYAYTEIMGYPALLKLQVEELFYYNTEGSGEINRDYILQSIEEESLSKRNRLSRSNHSNKDSYTISISDLYSLVKEFDKNFIVAPEVSEEMLNADGTPRVLYHQTEADIEEFDTRHKGAGTNDEETPFGIFMKPTSQDIGMKGKKQMALYARIVNPLVVANRYEMVRQIKAMSPAYVELLKQRDALSVEYKQKIEDAGKKWSQYAKDYRNTHPDATRSAIYEDEEFQRLFDAEDELTEEWVRKADELALKCKEEITQTLKKNGYDGVHLKQDEGSGGRIVETFIALDATQVKSATDNIGTFDGQDPYIRHALPKSSALAKTDAEEVENRRRLAAEKFGFTNDVECAGFVLPDGRMLNLSQYGLKGVQHKRIEAVFEDLKGDDAINRFVQDGNVRLKASSPGIEIGESGGVTVSQRNTIRRFIDTCLARNDRFFLDITAEDGSDIASFEYDSDTSTSDILYDIEKYYERGLGYIRHALPKPSGDEMIEGAVMRGYGDKPGVNSQTSEKTEEKKPVTKPKKTAAQVARENAERKAAAEMAQVEEQAARTVRQAQRSAANKVKNAEVLAAQKIARTEEQAARRVRNAEKSAENATKNAEKKLASETERLARESMEHIYRSSRESARINKNIEYLKNEVLHRKSTEGGLASSIIFGEPSLRAVVKVFAGRGSAYGIMHKSTRAGMQALLDWYRPDNEVLSGNAIDELLPTGGKDVGAVFGAYNADIRAAIERIANGVGNITARELADLDVVVNAVARLYQTYGTVKWRGKRIDASKLAYEAYRDMLDTRRVLATGREADGKPAVVMKKIWNVVREGYLYGVVTPEVVLRDLEHYSKKGVLSSLYREIRYGEAEAKRIRTEILMPVAEFFDKHKKYRRELTTKRRFEFGGHKITAAQAVGVWETSKREHARSRMLDEENGGVRISVYDEASGITETRHVKVTEVDLDNLYNQFSEEDKGYIKALEEAFKIATKYKEQTDGEVWGYTNTVKGHYYPITTDENYFARDVTDVRQLMGSVQVVNNKTFNKNTVEGAQAWLFIEDSLRVLERHAMGMGAYSGLFQPLQTFGLVYGAKFDPSGMAQDMQASDGTRADILVESVVKKTSLREHYNAKLWNRDGGSGTNLDKYLTKLFSDVQGLVGETTAIDKAVSWIQGNYVTATFGLNAKIILTQLASYATAEHNLDADVLVRALGMKNEGEAMDKYSRITKARAFDGVGAAEGLVDKLGELGRVATKGIDFTDRGVIVKLYNACRLQVEKDGGPAIDSEENLKAAAKLLDDLLLDTQTTSLKADASALMRSKNAVAKMFTMFRTESMKAFSNVYAAFATYANHRSFNKKGLEGYGEEVLAEDKKKIGKTVTAYLMSMTWVAAMTVLFSRIRKAARGEKEDEKLLVEGVREVVGNVVELLPIFSEIYSYATDRFDVEYIPIGVINDTLSMLANVGKLVDKDASDAERARYIRTSVHTLGNVLGLPAKNAGRVALAITSVVSKPTAYRVNDKTDTSPTYRSDLDRALEKGNDRLAQTVLSTWFSRQKGGKASSAVTDEILRLYKTVDGEGKSIFSMPKSVPSGLDSRQSGAFSAVYSEADDQIALLVASGAYLTLDDRARAKAIKAAYDMAWSRAAEAVGYEETGSALGMAQADVDPVLMAAVAGFAKAYEGSERKTQVVAYLKSLGLSKDEYNKYLLALGYKAEA